MRNIKRALIKVEALFFAVSNDITQEGSTVLSDSGDISYEAGNDILIKAGENSYTSTEKSESYNASYAYGTGGYSANAGFSLGGSTTDDIWHTNSVVRADGGKISMKTGQNANSKGDMTLSGANILGKNVDIEVKGNLRQESLQDTHRTDGKTVGMNAGISGGTKLSSAVSKYNTGQEGSTGLSGVSIGGHYGQTKEDSAWVNQQTSIVGSESVNINVGGKYSNKGALVANADYAADDNGNITYSNDKGNLKLNAKEFEYEDIEDHDYRNSYRYGGQVSLGKFDKEGTFAQNLGSGAKNSTVTGTFYNKGSEKEQINRATVGQGTITVDGKVMTGNDMPGLNRDITKSQEVTRDQITNALDAEVTVDVRLMTSVAGAILSKEKGVKDISVVQDLMTIYKSGGQALKALKDALGLGQTDLDKFMKLLTKDPEKMTKEEKEFLENILKEGRKRYLENALETGDYDLLMREDQDEIRGNKTKRMLYAGQKLENAATRGDTPVDKKTWDKDVAYVIGEIAKGKELTYCNSLLGGYLSDLDIYVPWKDEKGKWMTANKMTRYFEASSDWYEVPKNNGALDHEAANWWANQGATVVAAYDTGNDSKSGHVSQVIGKDELEKGVTTLKGYTFDSKQEDEASFNANYKSEAKIKKVKYFVYMPKSKNPWGK